MSSIGRQGSRIDLNTTTLSFVDELRDLINEVKERYARTEDTDETYIIRPADQPNLYLGSLQLKIDSDDHILFTSDQYQAKHFIYLDTLSTDFTPAEN